MASKRIQIANSKRTAHSAHGKREIAKLIENGKLEKALIRVEHIIRDDFTTEAYEILELMTDLLHERVKHLGNSEKCPPDLLEPVATILWASSRVDISELEDARKQLIKKFGKEFYEECKDNGNGKVNARVLLRLNILPPEPLLVRRYLIEIANQYNVEWDEEKCPIDITGRRKDDFIGASVQPAPSSGMAHLYSTESPPANVQSDNRNNGNGSNNGGGGGGGGLSAPPSYNESFEHPTLQYGVSPSPVTYSGQSLPAAPPVASPHEMEEEPPGVQLPVPPSGPNQQIPSILPQAPSLPNPPLTPSNPNPTNSTPSYDDLAARFAALKK